MVFSFVRGILFIDHLTKKTKKTLQLAVSVKEYSCYCKGTVFSNHFYESPFYHNFYAYTMAKTYI